jgi:hypothetical protein
MALSGRQCVHTQQAFRVVRPAQRRAVACQAVATISETRKLLASRGWHRAWIDGVTERIARKQVHASAAEMAAVVRLPRTLLEYSRGERTQVPAA